MATLIITFIAVCGLGICWGMGIKTMLNRYDRYKHLHEVIKGRRS